MTCLVAIKNTKGKIVMGADRRISWGSSHYQESKYSKVKKDNGSIFAFCGSCVLGNLIVNVMKRPKILSDIDVYVYYTLSNKIKSFLIERGFGKDKDLNVPEDMDLQVLIAIGGRLFLLEINHNIIQIDESNIPYCSGSGGHVAWGSLLSTENSSMSAKDRVKLAIVVSSKVVHSVDDNPDICVED
jgi:ATP-dependent protease HslVU (ClpYQ) peptidase subunit